MVSARGGVRVDPGEGSENLLEPLEGPDVAVARGCLRQPQNGRGLGVGQLLEVSQGEDLAVERVHAVEGFLKAQLPLGADGGLCGTGESAEEEVGERVRAGGGASAGA